MHRRRLPKVDNKIVRLNRALRRNRAAVSKVNSISMAVAMDRRVTPASNDVSNSRENPVARPLWIWSSSKT